MQPAGLEFPNSGDKKENRNCYKLNTNVNTILLFYFKYILSLVNVPYNLNFISWAF